MRYVRNLAQEVRTRTASAVRKVKRWWRQHRERMAEEMDYADAFAAVVMAAVELINDSYRVRWISHQLVAAYIALLRAFAPHVVEADLATYN